MTFVSVENTNLRIGYSTLSSTNHLQNVCEGGCRSAAGRVHGAVSTASAACWAGGCAPTGWAFPECGARHAEADLGCWRLAPFAAKTKSPCKYCYDANMNRSI